MEKKMGKEENNDKKIGKGKEYNSDGSLKFEGIYLYDFRLNGREYIQGKLVYEGEYMYGKKWNGKGYDENGNINYELNNGNGKVKEYYESGKLEFEGQLVDGKKNGEGKEYNYDGKLIFSGEYLNGKQWNGKRMRYCKSFIDEEISECELINGMQKIC